MNADDVTDFVVGLIAHPMADFKSSSLRAQHERNLAADPGLLEAEFQKARESIGGKECSTAPAGTIITRCTPNAKAARRAERLDLVARGVHGCSDHAETAARLRRDMDEVEHARLAKHVYLKYDENTPEDLKAPPPGFLDASPEDLVTLGLTQGDLTPDGTSFRAAVYKKDPAVWGENAKPEFEVAFRGSTTAKEDWENNMAQNANQESSYYQRAVIIGNAISRRGLSDNVNFVGHSLGGGMSLAAQGSSGATATTFNSASLNPRTVTRYLFLPSRQQSEPDKILAYQVKGEVLSTTQETGLTSLFTRPALGKRFVVPPSSEALPTDDRHGIDEVIKAIEAQKSADEAALKNCLGIAS